MYQNLKLFTSFYDKIEFENPFIENKVISEKRSLRSILYFDLKTLFNPFMNSQNLI